MDARSYFAGKKITVMGLGLLGRGLGDVRFLASCGAELIVTDLKTEAQLAESLGELKDLNGITYVLGEHRLEDFRDRDLILKAAGVPLDSPFIAEARKQGTPIRMSADLFAELSGAPIIGVTGTRGKSTVTHMLEAILEEAGTKVLLGGNVRGVSTLALLPQVTADAVGLLELDSWQLQGFGEAGISPHIAVFTTFYPDHLNYYHDDLDAYLQDKANIFLNQKEDDTLILGKQCAPLVIDKYGEQIESRVKVVDTPDLPDTWVLAIPGMHNRYDAALALAAARVRGIADDVSRKALSAFAGVPGRLQLVRTVHGISYYNDTNSTTPEATMAALEAFADTHPGKVVLIMGGANKGLDMEAFLDAVPRRTKHVTLLAGTGTDEVKSAIPDAEVFDSLKGALADAQAHAEAGDIILFSPAFASFGMFKNEYDRGDQFIELVNAS